MRSSARFVASIWLARVEQAFADPKYPLTGIAVSARGLQPAPAGR